MKRKILKALVFILKVPIALLIILMAGADIVVTLDVTGWARVVYFSTIIAFSITMVLWIIIPSYKIYISMVITFSIYLLMYNFNPQIIMAQAMDKCYDTGICPEGIQQGGG